MSRQQHVRRRRPAAVQSRTSDAVKNALEAEALRLSCTESEVVHIILSQHFGYDPLSGLKVSLASEVAPGSAEDGPAGMAS